MNQAAEKKFVRRFDESQQNLLKNPDDLFIKHISGDVISGNVFPAFRNNTIDFYHRGGKVFHFVDGKYSTHIKYASVLQGYNKPYIDEKMLNNATLIKDFKGEGYARIKENCSLYSGVESAGVSTIFARSSFALSDLKNNKPSIVVLDIEVSLQALDEEWDEELEVKNKKRSQDRIDLLLYNTETKTLQFFEVKHFSNKELWSSAKTEPPVVGQVKRYNKQLTKKHDEVLSAYQNYTKIARDLFGLSTSQLPDPEHLKSEVILLVFGFDNNQKKKIEELLIEDGSLKEISARFFGNPKSASEIWNEKTIIKNVTKALSEN